MTSLSLRCLALCLLLSAATAALAQKAAESTYPSRPVRMIVAQAAGGPTDVAARVYASRLSEVMGQQAVVDNRQGAGGSVAGEITARAPADGYTLMIAANGTLAIAPHLIKLSYNARKDMVPVALIGNSPLGLMVHSPLAVASVKELLALAKARPGKINFGSSGAGATSHLSGELLKMMTGIQIVHVPYKGAGPALIGLVSGEIEMLISGLSSGLPFIKQKQVRLLAVSSAKRAPLLPEVPSIAETVPGYDVSSWYAVLAPAATPRPIIERLHQMSQRVVNDAAIQAKLISLGMDPDWLTLQQLSEKMQGEYDRWGKVVKAAGMKSN